MRLGAWLTALMLLGIGRTAHAQCADGSMPPCGDAKAPPRIDANAIAILPFRVTGADASLAFLRDGMPYLLAAEFNGDGVPRAVEPDEVFRAVRRVGVGRELTAAERLRVGRAVGAGQVLVGAVVGAAAGRITVTVSIINTRDGSTAAAPLVVDGTADSLAGMAAALSTRAAGRAAGAWRLTSTPSGTTTDSAVRAYLAAHEARRSGAGDPVALFLKALRSDTTFALAAYWLSIQRRLENAFPADSAALFAFRLAWSQRDRLSNDQRLLLEAALGPNGPDPNDDRAVIRGAVERAALALPRSFEAWYLYGDGMMHDGALLGYANWLPRATRALAYALTIDTTPGLVEHLGVLAFASRDRARVAEMLAITSRRWPKSTNETTLAYALRQLTGPGAALMAARKASVQGAGGGLLTSFMTPAERDSLFATEMHDGTEPRRRSAVQQQDYIWSINHGRPERAAAARAAFAVDSVASSTLAFRLDAATAEDFAFARRALAQSDNSALRQLHCEAMLGSLRRGDTTGADSVVARLRLPKQPAARLVEIDENVFGDRCASLIVSLVNALAPDGRAGLVAADSMLRAVPRGASINFPHWNYDAAIAFARRGEYQEAAAAARRRLFGRGQRLTVAVRDEGRWSLLAGDTTGAIAAFRRYLDLRSDPEASLVPERDSIRVLVEKLAPARRRR